MKPFIAAAFLSLTLASFANATPSTQPLTIPGGFTIAAEDEALWQTIPAGAPIPDECIDDNNKINVDCAATYFATESAS